MRSPPNPTHSIPGRACCNARARFAPCKSPLGSPAEMKIRMKPPCSRGWRDSQEGNTETRRRGDKETANAHRGRWSPCLPFSLSPGLFLKGSYRRLHLDAWQDCWLGDFAITERAADFQHFAPS